MKKLKITLVLLISIITTNIFATENVRIFHDATYMDKFYYKVENLSAFDYHIAYHIYTSNSDRVILNMSMSSYKTLDAATATETLPATGINWDKSLVNKINSGLANLELVFQENNLSLIYEVSSAVYVSETDDKLSVSGAYYSFSYYKNKVYNPGSDLDGGLFPTYDDQVVFMNNNVDTRACFRQFELIKVIRETHPKGSFTMIANEDFTKLTTSDVMETCQSALYVDYVENVGIVEERTKNGKITLVGINDLRIEDYLAQSCGTSIVMPVATNNNVPTPTTAPTNTTITNQSKGEPGLNFYTRGENTAKSGGNVSTKTNNTNTVVTNNTTTVEDDYIILFDMEETTATNTATNTTTNTVSINQSKGGERSNTALPTTKVVHIVDNGETLYSISKKYDVSILEIQRMNNLPNSSIDVTQELVIYRKK
jgi:LysM repeat protein